MGMIIAKQTAAKTEQRFFSKGSIPKTVAVVGTLVAEEIAVNVVDEDGSTRPLYDDGVAVTLTATSGPLMIDSPIALEFAKPLTANAVGVMLVD